MIFQELWSIDSPHSVRKKVLYIRRPLRHTHYCSPERGDSVVESLTRDQGVVGSSLTATVGTVLCP